MRLEQYVGPFSTNQVIFNKSNVKYLQLGIEHPHSIPLSEFDWPIVLSIDNSTDFVLTTKDILEFKPMNRETITVTIKKGQDNPYLIINAAYEDAT